MGVTTDDGLCLLMSVDLAEATKVFAGLPVERQLETWENLSSDPASKSPADLAKLLETVILATPVPVAGAAERKHVRELSARVANLTSNWAGRDPAAAAAWVGQLPAGESQTTAAENLVLAWGRHDLPAAQAWVEQLPPGPARDKAGEQLAELVKSSGGG